MTQQILESKLVDILTDIQTAVNQTGDFTFIQLPDVVHQYITYTLVVDSFWIFSIPIILGVLGIFALRWYNQVKHDDESAILIWGVYGAIFLSASVFWVFNIFEVLQIWIAPKVWILHKILTIISGTSS